MKVHFGNHIRTLRHQSGQTLQEVAHFLDADETSLYQMEQGQQNPSKGQVLILANCLGVDETHLLHLYLEQRLLQNQETGKSSKRSQNLMRELIGLEKRRIRTMFHKPGPPLNGFVQNIMYYEGNNKVYPFERALPDGKVHLVFNLEETVPGQGFSNVPKKCRLSGVQERYTTCPVSPGEKTISVQFTPGGFYMLANLPASEIKNRSIDADQIFGRSILLLREELLACNNAAKAVGLVEQYFLKRIAQEGSEYAIVRFMADNITMPLDQLVQKTGYSHKHVIYIFKKHTGISPKYFQRISRFNRSLHGILAANGGIDWQDIVFQYGFYDQAHFIREFSHFSGLTPHSYLQTGSTCSKLLHLGQAG